jgi:hypothetical protein
VEVAVFGREVLSDHRVAEVLLGLLGALPGLGPLHYDENAQQRWRAFDAARLSQDIVVQRTHFIHVVCEDGVALIDTGRRTGQWQLRVRCPEALEADAGWWRAQLAGSNAETIEFARDGEPLESQAL